MWGFPVGEWIQPTAMWPRETGSGESGTLVDAWRRGVSADPGRVQLRCADQAWTRADLDVRTDALAAAWQDGRLVAGDRVVVQLQNVPLLVTVVLAAWKLGAVVVPANPMYRERELTHVLADSDASVLVHDGGRDAIDAARAATVPQSVTAEELDAVREMAMGRAPTPVIVTSGQPALITYTSGTTGPAKGAVATHANVLAGASIYRDELGVDDRSVILAMAPLCHVTGMIGHLAVSLLNPNELVLMGRFEPDLALELVERHGVTFTIGALTAYRALLTSMARTPRDVSSLTCLYSGGAPVAPAVADEVERVLGVPLGNAYGLTESTSISHATPLGAASPVDAATGALSIGKPVGGTRAWIQDENGNRLGTGEPGELVISGPGVVGEYWRNPSATTHALPDGALRTGDVAIVDDDEWFYLIDRQKDQINASGFKVWPREVEDVLYEHPAIDAAAVFGIADDYRGESVAAAVVLRDGHAATADELIAFTRERLAPYKCPRTIQILDALPMTASGKILRRELRSKEERTRA